ncbi:MAG: sensor histidine kinase [Opitutaceae bacterium]|nr:sensor histidine kinase [Opitutaceae bacterium]
MGASSTSPLHSLRGRLAVLVAAILLPVFGTLILLITQAYRNESAAVTAELANTARAVAGIVDAEVERNVAILRTLAATNALKQRDWARLDDTARRALAGTGKWLVVVDPSGRQIVNTLLPLGEPIPPVQLETEYVEAMKKGSVYASNIIHGPAAKRLVVHIGLPLLEKGEWVYGLSVVMGPEVMSEAVNVQRFAPSGVLSVLDHQGRIIMRNPAPEKFVGHSATADIVKATRENQEGIGESVTLENIPVLLAYTHARCGWSVAMGFPKERVYASARHLLSLATGFATIVLLLAVALAIWIGRAVVRSVESVVEDAAVLAQGKIPAPRSTGLGETDFIDRAIRDMAEALARELSAKTQAEGDLREAQDKLRHYAAELEKKVEERTTSLREAVAQMEEFSYTVSHDLRSPLRTIKSFIHVLLEDHGGDVTPQVREYLERIRRAAERMDRLSLDILNYSRVSRAEVQQSTVDVEKVVRELIAHYSELHPSRADVFVATPMPLVKAHEASLAQSLANLLTNAAKFVHPGVRPRIEVRSETRDSRVRIWIADNGIGLAKAQQERLFRIFERAASARGYEGNGVGLAIVRKAMEKMGGSFGVESDGVTGSRFWIELPAAD